MDIGEMITKMGGLKSMAAELGVSEQQAATGAAALVPAILGGFKKQAAPTGLGGLSDLLGKLGGGELLDNVVSPQPTDVSRGNGVLASIFGSKDVSRAVAQDAGAKSGLDPAMLKKMLPIVAMMVAGYMAKQKGASNDRPASGAGLGGLLGKLTGGGGGLGGLGALLGAGGGGNALEDVLRKMGR
jgi:hypothetical protein